jgi:Na+-translocating ferredoxin:NAD+ oxidoreductase RnfG subunit
MQTVTADDHQRIIIPDAKPGQQFAYEASAGTITLKPVKTTEPKTIYAKLVKHDGRLTFEVPNGATVTPESIAEAVQEEREAHGKIGIR